MGNNKVTRNEKRKKKTALVFVYTYKIWQILKRFAGTFRQAQTLKLGRIMTKSAFSSYFTKKKISFKLSIKVLIKFVKEI